MDIILIPILNIARILIGLYTWVVVATVILNWLIIFKIINVHSQLMRVFLEFLFRLTDPLLSHIRRLVPFVGGNRFIPYAAALRALFSSRNADPDLAAHALIKAKDRGGTVVQILDGRKVAESLSQTLSKHVARFKEISGRSPCLAALRVGEHPPSLIYLKRKREAAEKLGISFREEAFPEDASLSSLQAALIDLNAAPEIDGIILQLPLPSHLNSSLLLCCVHPQKDVDGLHPLNQGSLLTSSFGGIIPCTPLACLKLIQAFGFDVKGRRCVVIGRSTLVGKPLGLLLLNHHGTVTFCHSQTLDLEKVTQAADFLFVAMGKPGFIQAHHVKPGACVVDIGIHQLPSSQNSNNAVQGDVCFESVAQVAGALSPVPGGVGPLTVFSLMENTLKAAYRSCGLTSPLS